MLCAEDYISQLHSNRRFNGNISNLVVVTNCNITYYPELFLLEMSTHHPTQSVKSYLMGNAVSTHAN
jgi:hypothetical protein